MRLWVLGVLVALVSLAATLAAGAAIHDDEELVQVGSKGSGAGQLQNPNGIATDPVTGHVYTTEEGGYRVSEFTPWGDFVKAFGWDVAPGAVNDQQEVRVRASEGQFKLTFGGDTTADLAFNAPGPESKGPGSVEAALNALPSIGAGGVSVSSVPGTTDGKTPTIYVVAFKGGSLAGTDVAPMTAGDGTTPLAGGDPSTSLEVRTRADGHAPTTGLEACTAELGCQKGLEGAGAGQLDSPAGVAVDAAGNVYVREVGNLRVQKFDSAGRFVLMFGGKVNKTTNGNICTKASGNECGTGSPGTGNGEFSGFSRGIALSGGKLFVTDLERIQRFNLEGEYEAEVPVAEKVVFDLAIAPGGNFYYVTLGTPLSVEENVYKLDATGKKIGLCKGTGIGQGAVATDAAGNVYVGDGNRVLQFDADCTLLTPPSCCEATPSVNGLGTNSEGTLYVAYTGADSFLRAYGPPPVKFESAAPLAPEISAQFAGPVGRKEATVAAEINPNFWTDTTYYVQYGTDECAKGGCPAQAPAPPARLTTNAVKAPLRSAGLTLVGLQPGTTYHYRFVAESSGGGPVFGIDPDGGGSKEASEAEGLEGTFTTFPLAPTIPPCANDLFRVGPAARLPDCRAYEMVSPLDKNNGDILSLLDFPAYTTALSVSASDGGRFSYSSSRGFADPEGAPYTDQYLATRDPQNGWSTEALALPMTSGFEGNPSFENKYKAFSADLCSGWAVLKADPPAAPGAPPGYTNVYRRGNCGGGLEALIQVPPSIPPTLGEGELFPVLTGASADGGEALFNVEDALADGAASGVWQAYHASGGKLRLLCRLPDGTPIASHCSAGTGEMGGGAKAQPQLERLSSFTHALSADGSRAYWTDSGTNEAGPGQIYLRLNAGEAQSAIGGGGECTEPEMACTVEVSGPVTPDPSRFLGASADGSRALFEVTAGSQAGELYRFDLGAGGSILLADETRGVAAASDDLSRVYFVSEEALAAGALAGEPNLYFYDEGTTTFIATVPDKEVGGGSQLSIANPLPIYHGASATPDGRVLAFLSGESLTGYDNADLQSGEADLEVFVYEADSAELRCVSCNPSGARPVGRRMPVNGAFGSMRPAAWIALPPSSLYSPRVLSSDGRRLFFNSIDALLPRDTNAKADVYEWSSAQSQQVCDQIGAELYVPDAGGCLSLISTGESPQNSEFLDASAVGGDAFFSTNASLLPRDPGLVDVYDARAGGGIVEPLPPAAACQGETCQPAIAAPSDPTPSSSSYIGPEDEVQKKQPYKKKKAANKKKKKKKGKGKRNRGGGNRR